MAISLLRSMYNLGIPVNEIGRMFVIFFSFISGEFSFAEYIRNFIDIIRDDDTAGE